MLTKRQKEILLGEKNSYYRKVLSNARKKALASSEDLKFLSEIDPKTRELVLKPMLLSNVKAILEDGKIERKLTCRTDAGVVRLRKGLPYREKKKLEATGQGDIAKLFDGKVMVQMAGILRDSNGAPLKKDTQIRFAYDLLTLVHQMLKENSKWPWNDKAVFDVTESSNSISPSFRNWSVGARGQLDLNFFECLACALQNNPDGKHIVLLRY